MVRQAKNVEEHREDLVCLDNPKEFFGYVNKHGQCEPLDPMFSSEGHFETNNEEMNR